MNMCQDLVEHNEEETVNKKSKNYSTSKMHIVKKNECTIKQNNEFLL